MNKIIEVASLHVSCREKLTILHRSERHKVKLVGQPSSYRALVYQVFFYFLLDVETQFSYYLLRSLEKCNLFCNCNTTLKMT